jgi:hypothetical protein
MSEQPKNEYLDAAGQCPCCGSDDTETIRSYDDPDGLRRRIEYQCNEPDCGVEFTEFYAIAIALEGKYVNGTLHQSETQYVAGPAAEDALELLEALETLVFDLEESHQDEIRDDHGGDDPGTCSYCRDLAAAQKLIDGIRGVECEESPQGNEKDPDQES